jgi:hypothetical protein
MVIDPGWRDFAAIWGAGLATALALGKFLPARPRFHVEPGDKPVSDLTIRIINPAKRMCFVRELGRWHIGGPQKALGIYTGSTPMDQVGVPGSLFIGLKGEDEREVRVNCIINNNLGENNRWLIWFGWQGGWVLPVWFPVPVFVSTKRAAKINEAR